MHLRRREILRYNISRGIDAKPFPWPFVLITSAGILALIAFGYTIPWTGFRSVGTHAPKTLWDWMDLILVPVLLAGIAIAFSRSQKDREIALSNIDKGADALQQLLAYLTELLLDNTLNRRRALASASRAARARTIAALDMLTPTQKGHLVRFLTEAGLINAKAPFISLERGNLQSVYLDPGLYKECSFHSANLDEASLSHCTFWDSDFSSSTMQLSDLGSSDFHGCDMNYINARRSYLREARFVQARLLKADFTNGNLRSADFRRASLRSGRFKNADLRLANFENADLQFADFRVTDLRGASFAGADLTGATLYGANLRGADLTGANLSHAYVTPRQLRSAKSVDRAWLPARR